MEAVFVLASDSGNKTPYSSQQFKVEVGTVISELEKIEEEIKQKLHGLTTADLLRLKNGISAFKKKEFIFSILGVFKESHKKDIERIETNVRNTESGLLLLEEVQRKLEQVKKIRNQYT